MKVAARTDMLVRLESAAPDLFGFGRSDKPREDAGYTFDFHRDSLITLIHALNLPRATTSSTRLCLPQAFFRGRPFPRFALTPVPLAALVLFIAMGSGLSF
jgi:hypothetical protein